MLRLLCILIKRAVKPSSVAILYEDFLTIGSTMRPELINITGGLIGHFDTDPSNDFRLRDGTTLPSDATTEELHAFGLSWKIRDLNESLFYYEDGHCSRTAF